MIEVVAMAAVEQQAEAADLTGRYEGALRIGETSLSLVVRVSQGPDGLIAVMDSPAQGATDMPINGLSEAGGTVRFSIPSVGGRFEGVRSADGSTWTGAWSQGGGSLPLILTRVAATAEVSAPAAPSRPQTPVPPFPYLAEAVTFANRGAGITLAGTLTKPEGQGPFPAVILLTGSGAQDRDETIFDHKPFAVWADALTRRGVAVLRYDDRGVGGSGGGSRDETTADFAGDARAAMDYLALRPDIDASRIGLMGHSEGGSTALIAASEGAPAAFVVMIAGPALSGAALLPEQYARITSAAGASPEQVTEVRRVRAALMDAAVRNRTDSAATAREVEAILTAEGAPEATRRQEAAALSSGWYRYFAAYDPGPALGGLRAPLLALYGGKDLNVPADLNGSVVTRLKPDATVVVLPGLNHLMQHAQTGLGTEYGTITETLAPEAIATVVEWVVATTGAR